MRMCYEAPVLAVKAQHCMVLAAAPTVQPAVPLTRSEDQGHFPGKDLPAYTKELKYGSEEHPIRC
jgi:hypothetical protein